MSDVHGVIIWGESFGNPVSRHRACDHRRQAGRGCRWGRRGTGKSSFPLFNSGGTAIITARGASSAASAASAAIDHVRDWALGTDEDWVSMGVASDGSYGISEGVVYSYPVRCPGGGRYEIVQGLAIDEFSRERMDASDAELREERGNVDGLEQV